MQQIKVAVKAILIALAFYIAFEAMLTIITTMVDAQERMRDFTQRVTEAGG